MCKRHRFPPDIIQYVVWLCHRFNLSTRDIEDLIPERGVNVTYETIRTQCYKFGPLYAARLRRRQNGFGDTLFLDEVFVKIKGVQHYLWRAAGQDGNVVDVDLQKKRDGAAARRFFKRILRSMKVLPRLIVTDKLRSYDVAHRELGPEASRNTSRYATNRAERSHQPTRMEERKMRRFKSVQQAQRFLNTHSAIQNLFNLGRHHIRAEHYLRLRDSAFASWEVAVAA